MKGIYGGAKQFGKMFSAQVDGNYIGFGPVDPASLGIESGDEIEFEVKKNGKYTNADLDTVKIVAKAASASSSSSGSPASSGSMNKNDYWEAKAEADKERQTVIEHQSSRNAAITVVEMMITNGLVSLPKQADKEDYAMNLIDSVTKKFNTDLENVRQFGLQVEEAASTDSSSDELEG